MNASAAVSRLLSTQVKRPLRLFRDRAFFQMQRFRNSFAAFRSNRAPGSSLDIACIGHFQVAYRVGTPDESILEQHSFDHDIYFPAIPQYTPAATDVIIDIGAHIGGFALLAASKVPDGAVHAIEACHETCNLLQINAALNRLDNIHVAHLALTGYKGTGTLYYDLGEGNWGHSMTNRYSKYGETVPTDTLGNYMRDHHIERCQLAKLNCEGAEFDILLNSSKDILGRIERLIILYHCDLAGTHTEAELLDHLKSCGFATTLQPHTPGRGWIIAEQNRAS